MCWNFAFTCAHAWRTSSSAARLCPEFVVSITQTTSIRGRTGAALFDMSLRLDIESVCRTPLSAMARFVEDSARKLIIHCK